MSHVHPSDKLVGTTVFAVSALFGLEMAFCSLPQRSLETLFENLAYPPGTFQFEAGMFAAVTLGFVVLGLVGIAVGYGIRRSKRWAFSAGLIFSVLSAVLYANYMRLGIVWAIVYALLAIYCFARLTGKLRPPDQHSGQKASQ